MSTLLDDLARETGVPKEAILGGIAAGITRKTINGLRAQAKAVQQRIASETKPLIDEQKRQLAEAIRQVQDQFDITLKPLLDKLEAQEVTLRNIYARISEGEEGGQVQPFTEAELNAPFE